MNSIGIIGMGNMGFAIAQGLKKTYADLELAVIDKDTNLAKKNAEDVNATAYSTYTEFLNNSDIVIIAVKPQHLKALFEEIAGYARRKKIITIAAGKKISFFTENLQTDQVIRFMPNIAAKTSSALTGISFGENTTDSFRKDAVSIAEAFGKSVILPESLMPAVTGLSGSGIAYVFAFIHALALGGTDSGIPYDTSLDIAVQTVEGAVSLLKHERINPVTSLTKVISAGGTTIAGIKALEEHAFTASVMEAVDRACKRAKEFEK